MTTISPLGVDRLVGGNRIEPRTELPAFLERVALLVDLEERRLEHILGQGGVTQEPTKVIIQFPLVARDQLGEEGRIASFAVRLQQLFVADGRRIDQTLGRQRGIAVQFFLGLLFHPTNSSQLRVRRCYWEKVPPPSRPELNSA